MGMQRRFFRDVGHFSIRPLVQKTNISETTDRFINQSNNDLTPDDFKSRWYAGAVSELNFSNQDNNVSPRDGFSFNNKLSWQSSLSESDRTFTTYGTNFTFYKSFCKRKNLIFATRIGTELIRGDYDFFFAPTLGQDENLRGYYGQRFRGATNFFHMTDLRLGIGSVRNSILPFSFGITGSFDYGKIFDDGDNSELWHSSYGGGIWIAPLNIAIISFSYNQSTDGEGARFRVGLGHGF